MVFLYRNFLRVQILTMRNDMHNGTQYDGGAHPKDGPLQIVLFNIFHREMPSHIIRRYYTLTPA